MWHAKRHNGFGITGLPDTFCVADLSTYDQDGASRFYEQLFKWRIGKYDPSHNYYHLFNHDEFLGEFYLQRFAILGRHGTGRFIRWSPIAMR